MCLPRDCLYFAAHNGAFSKKFIRMQLNELLLISLTVCGTRRCASLPEWLHFGLADEEPMLSDHSTDSTVVPAEIRCSVKTKIQLRKPNLRKRRSHRYSTSASSSSPFQGMP